MESFEPWLLHRVALWRLEKSLRPYPAEEMIAYPESTWVNNPANDTPECIEPFPGQRVTTN